MRARPQEPIRAREPGKLMFNVDSQTWTVAVGARRRYLTVFSS